jgi:hypothetical protein
VQALLAGVSFAEQLSRGTVSRGTGRSLLILLMTDSICHLGSLVEGKETERASHGQRDVRACGKHFAMLREFLTLMATLGSRFVLVPDQWWVSQCGLNLRGRLLLWDSNPGGKKLSWENFVWCR